MKTILIATGNRGKIREIEAILAPLGVALKTPQDYPDVPEAVEDADTFEGNAIKKATHWLEATGLPTIADDSGLAVDALNGEPGVRSARYAETTEARNAKLLDALKEMPIEKRGAKFVSVVAFARPDTETVTRRGECPGRIHHEHRGDGGFGYDPIFWMEEHGCTMAEMSAEKKNQISHRGRALAAMRTALEEWAKEN